MLLGSSWLFLGGLFCRSDGFGFGLFDLAGFALGGSYLDRRLAVNAASEFK